MVIMALDHIRDFVHYGAQHFSPEDLSQTTPAIFFTRWITHFCAPVFVFLAGTSAYLSAGRGRDLRAVSHILWTRGLWLIVVEMTLVLFGGTFNFSYSLIIWQVIWAIGWSMIALSVLMYLPWRALLLFSVAMIGLHNTLDRIRPEQFGSLGWLWKILHVGFSAFPLGPDHLILSVYPLIPWIGVMSAGYCFGRVMELDAAERRHMLFRIGGAVTAAFVLIRFVNIYGDPNPWTSQPRTLMTLLSFLNPWKYPPSLDFLLMTLGPAMIALALFDRIRVSERNPFLVFGRVPFFYYVIHWYALHVAAICLAWFRYGHVDFMFGLPPSLLGAGSKYPADYGYGLGIVYIVWIAVVAALYPLCLWFARVKATRRSRVLAYL